MCLSGPVFFFMGIACLLLHMAVAVCTALLYHRAVGRSKNLGGGHVRSNPRSFEGEVLVSIRAKI